MMALSAKRPSHGDAACRRILDEVTEASGRKRRLNAEIDEEIYRRIKMRAAEEGRSISDITRDLWTEHLSK